jgi:hypothetical protein
VALFLFDRSDKARPQSIVAAQVVAAGKNQDRPWGWGRERGQISY